MPLLAAEPGQIAVAVTTGTTTGREDEEWQTVWRVGHGDYGFVPGAAGVKTAAAVGDHIVFRVLSGVYTFRLRDSIKS